MDRLIKKILSMQATGCQIDSRLIKKNEIFFALKGNRVDGHSFLMQVAQKEALVAVIDRTFDLKNISNLRVIQVDNVLKFLQVLAAESLKFYKPQVIGITGSMGKTTTKEYLWTLLNGSFSTSKTHKNYNSQAGLPIAILNMNKDVDFLVLEMGMDEKNEIKKLVQIAPPDIALITQVVDYRECFKSIEDIAEAKKEIFSHKRTKVKIINRNLLKFKAFQNGKYLTYSIKDKKADFYLDIINSDFYEFSKKIKINLPFYETHLLENLTGAISICRILEMKYEDIFKRFSDLKSEPMRFEKVKIRDILFIKDCYNANPFSTEIAIKNIPNIKGKKIAVLGSNLELGEVSKKAHENIIKVAKKCVDEILCFGDEFKHIKDIKIFSDHKSLACHLIKIMKKDDVVLVKGSRAMKLEKIFDFIN